jgi:hypothetical protein
MLSSCLTSRSWRSISSFSRASSVVRRWPVAGSSHTPGGSSRSWRSFALARFRSRSKVLLRAGHPAGDLFDPVGLVAHGPRLAATGGVSSHRMRGVVLADEEIESGPP